jgi:hypothetical protein
MTDEPRLLRRGPLAGYTSTPILALLGEPEAVDLDTQEGLTREARRRDQARQAEAWRVGRGLILDGIRIVRTGRPSKRVASHLRVLQRQVERVDAELRDLG